MASAKGLILEICFLLAVVQFSSVRSKEPFLDFTCVASQSLIPSSDGTSHVTISVHTPFSNGSVILDGLTRNALIVSQGGAFNCSLDAEEDEADTTVIISKKDASFYPSRLTVTYDPLVDDATIPLQMKVREDCDGQTAYRWREVFRDANKYPNEATLQLTGDLVANRSSIVFRHFFRRCNTREGYVQVLFRECPSGKWNLYDCQRECSICLNGGMCHPRTGECICPPGFNGTQCQNVYGRNVFGQKAQYRCNETSDPHDPGCRGKLFCLPEPFGCTCAAGYRGINCSEECQTGTFGANCEQKCRCTVNSTCWTDTGECVGSSCLRGWTGPNCQEPNNLVSLEFNYVNRNQTTNVTCSVINMSPFNENDFVLALPNGTSVAADYFNKYRNPFHTMEYIFVIVADFAEAVYTCTDVNKTAHVTVIVRTYEPPQLFNPPTVVSSTIDTVTLTWDPWDTELGDSGEGPVVKYIITYSELDGEADTVTAGETRGNTTLFVVQELKEATSYEFRVAAARPGVGGIGAPSPPTVGNTSCGVPGKPTNFKVAPVNATSLKASWSLPANTNCTSITYSISYWMRKQGQCQRIMLKNAIKTYVQTRGLSYVIDQLLPHTTYVVSLESPPDSGTSNDLETRKRTNQSVPGPPILLSNETTNTTATFMWKEPDCEDRNGKILGYHFQLLYANMNIENERVVLLPSPLQASFDNLTPCTNYTFRVRGWTSVGNGTFSNPVMVTTKNGVPDVVEGLEITAINSTKLSVTWQPPTTPCPVIDYTVSYTLIQRGNCNQSLQTEPQTMTVFETQADLSGLLPYSRYKVVVRAKTDSGEGSAMDKTEQTAEGVPGPPTSIVVFNKTSDSLTFNWEPPDCTQRNGLIMGYRATLRNASGIIETLDTEETHVMFDDLPACAMFTFEVAATTSAGFGEFSNLSKVTTESEEPDAVENLRTFADTKVFEVTWEPPDDAPCDIIGYNVTYKLLDHLECGFEDETQVFTAEHNFTKNPNFTVINPSPYSKYQVSVFAVTQAGAGEQASDEVRTLQDVPSSPISVVNTHSTSTSLNFTWEPPPCENRNGEILGYHYQLTDAATNTVTNETTEDDDDDDDTTIMVEGLKPCTQYEFIVQARTTEGYGSFSNVLPVVTLSQAPQPVASLKVPEGRRSSNSIFIRWNARTNEPCAITDYLITYKLIKHLQCTEDDSDSVKVTKDSNAKTYNITSLSPASKYLVTVQARNGYGPGESVGKNITTREAVPSPPISVNNTKSTPTSLTFTWEPLACENRNGVILGYHYQLKDTANSNVKNATTADDETTVTLEGLVSCTRYEFKVRAWSSQGYGSFSTAVYATTSDQVPEQVEKPTVNQIESTSALISWSSPISETKPCQIQQYIVMYQLTELKECGPGTNKTSIVKTNDTQIKLENLHPFSVYDVSVVARTAAGLGEPSPKLKIETNSGEPLAPVSVSNTHATSTSLTFVWEPPACENRNGEILSYRYLLKNTATNRNVKRMDTAANVNMVTVNKLKSCTLYEFKVKARTSAGGSIFSTAVNASTSDQAPSAVENLSIQHENFTSLQLTWSKPANTTCPITNYEVSYKLIKHLQCSGNETNSSRSVNVGLHQSYVLAGLSPASQYVVSVMARTVGGLGMKKTVYGETSEAVPTGPPQNVVANETGTTFIHFTWQPPRCDQQNGQIVKYAYALLVSATNESAEDGHKRMTDVLISDLDPYVEYVFTVRANTLVGPGPPSRLVVLTNEGAPSQPTNVAIVSPGKYTLELQWHRPTPPSGIISAYQIKYWQQGLDENSIYIENLTDPTNLQHQYTIRGLKPYTQYYVRVRGRTGAGYGLWSQNVTGRTDQAAPEKPASADVTNRTENAISVTWEQPQVLNGVLTGYKIEYKMIDITLGPSDDVQVSSEYQVITASEQASTTTLKELRPATGYEIRIAAQTVEVGEYEKLRPTYTKIPVIDEKPTMPAQPALSDDNIVTLQLRPISSPYVSVYQVTVTTKPSNRKRDTTSVTASSYQQSPENYIAAEFDKSGLPQTFQVGDNKTYGAYYNPSLMYDTKYDIRLCGVGRTEQDTQHSCSEPSSVTTNPFSNGTGIEAIIGAVIAVLVVIALILVVMVIIRKRQRSANSEYDNGVVLTNIEKAQGQVNGVQNQNQTVMEEMTRTTQLRRSDGVKGQSTTPVPQKVKARPPKAWKPHKPISLQELPGYVKRKKADNNKEFIKDYASFPNDQLYSCDAACKEDNKNKNRYANILPYDHSRVVLDPINDDPNTDYINASFIDGYKKKNAYIATQGHNKYSIPDFWRMVWQQEVAIIVMLTNLVENGKKKCTLYWPEDQQSYDNIVVKLATERVEQDFTERVFVIANVSIDEDIPREVRQFHYTTWPDMGLPDSPAPIMNFIHEVKQVEEENTGPMVVHCSAGVGRTGTFMTVDSMLNKVAEERQINVIDFVYEMRKKRHKMVQTQDQYMFIFEVLLETLLCGDTVMNIKTFPEQYEAMQQRNPLTGNLYLEEHFRVLDAMSATPSDNNCHGARNQLNLDKNRFSDCIPLDKSRPYLMSPGDENGTNYINASFVDSYKKKDGFLATQSPLPNTVIDFWRMVYDYKARVVVMLNQIDGSDETCAPYWIDDPEEIALYGVFEVQLRDCKSFKHTVARTFKLKNTSKASEKPRTIHHFAFKDWADQEVVPSSLTTFLGFMELVMSGQQQAGTDGRVAVHCLDGVSRSGLFCASMASLQKLKEEKVVDVFHAVRNLRRNRHSMVDTQDQYLFMYEFLDTYLEENQTYANFR